MDPGKFLLIYMCNFHVLSHLLLIHICNPTGIQLEKDCENLKEVLTRRSTLIQNVDSLSARNVELKSTLNRYLGDRSNQYFQIPPGQTIRVRSSVGKGSLKLGDMKGKDPKSKPGKSSDPVKLMSKTK